MLLTRHGVDSTDMSGDIWYRIVQSSGEHAGAVRLWLYLHDVPYIEAPQSVLFPWPFNRPIPDIAKQGDYCNLIEFQGQDGFKDALKLYVSQGNT